MSKGQKNSSTHFLVRNARIQKPLISVLCVTGSPRDCRLERLSHTRRIMFGGSPRGSRLHARRLRQPQGILVSLVTLRRKAILSPCLFPVAAAHVEYDYRWKAG